MIRLCSRNPNRESGSCSAFGKDFAVEEIQIFMRDTHVPVYIDLFPNFVVLSNKHEIVSKRGGIFLSMAI